MPPDSDILPLQKALPPGGAPVGAGFLPRQQRGHEVAP